MAHSKGCWLGRAECIAQNILQHIHLLRIQMVSLIYLQHSNLEFCLKIQIMIETLIKLIKRKFCVFLIRCQGLSVVIYKWKHFDRFRLISTKNSVFQIDSLGENMNLNKLRCRKNYPWKLRCSVKARCVLSFQFSIYSIHAIQFNLDWKPQTICTFQTFAIFFKQIIDFDTY